MANFCVTTYPEFAQPGTTVSNLMRNFNARGNREGLCNVVWKSLCAIWSLFTEFWAQYRTRTRDASPYRHSLVWTLFKNDLRKITVNRPRRTRAKSFGKASCKREERKHSERRQQPHMVQVADQRPLQPEFPRLLRSSQQKLFLPVCIARSVRPPKPSQRAGGLQSSTPFL
jgi:hypothetical protein